MAECARIAIWRPEMDGLRVLRARIERKRSPIPDACVEIGGLVGAQALRVN